MPQLSLYLCNAKGSKPSHFAILLVYHILKTCQYDQLLKKSGLQFDNWLFGPEKVTQDFRETGSKASITKPLTIKCSCPSC